MIGQTLRLLALTPKGQTPIAVTPQPAESLNDLITQGRALNSQKKYAEALPFFQRATQADPTNAVSWNLKADALLGLKRYEEALVASDKAVALDINFASAWFHKGGAPPRAAPRAARAGRSAGSSPSASSSCRPSRAGWTSAASSPSGKA